MILEPRTEHRVSTVTQEALANLGLQLPLEKLDGVSPRLPLKNIQGARVS